MKNKVRIFLCLLVIALCVPFLHACGNEPAKLNAPIFVNIQVDEAHRYIIADNNKKATEFEFYLYDGVDWENRENYLMYSSDKFYLDVTSRMNKPKTYYFFARYIGTGKFLDSDYSEIYSYNSLEQLEDPVLYLSNTNLTWTTVNNVLKYEIYANDTLFAETTNTEYDFGSEVSELALRPYNFSVMAVGGGNFVNSQKSNEIEFKDHLILKQPTELSITNNSLHWTGDQNASSYEIISNAFEVSQTTTNTYLDLANSIQEVGTYYFTVQALSDTFFTSSDLSSTYEYAVKKQLAVPSNFQYNFNGNNIIISWDNVPNCSSYSVLVNDELINDFVIVNQITIDYVERNIDLKNASIKVKSNQSGQYYLESNIGVLSSIRRKLDVPQLTMDINAKVISWSAIDNAVAYKIKIITPSSTQETPITGNSFDFSTYYSNYIAQNSSISVQIMALAPENNFYINSDYSAIYTYSIEDFE